MLSERGVAVAVITNIMLATLPYSWKFVISPFVERFIRRRHSIKAIAYVSQAVVFIGFVSLGLFRNGGSLLAAFLLVIAIVLAASVHDIVRGYVKLNMFTSQELGTVSAIENTGFRVGMFISGACVIYLANAIGWFLAFLIAGGCVLFSTIATFCVPRSSIRISAPGASGRHTLKLYLSNCLHFFKKYGVFSLLFIILSFKMTDSCINILKPAFMHHIGVSRLAFANISHLLGLCTMIISGLIAGVAISRIGTRKCVHLAFLAQMLTSSIFIYLSLTQVSLMLITVLVNISTFIFGFSNVVFRTFAAQEARRDVNMYTVVLSLVSFIRICLYPLAGFITTHYSWWLVYLICLLSNLPGIAACSKLTRLHKQDAKG